MGKYECTAYGYIYEPNIGNVTNGIDYGTDFDYLPDDWECPVCGEGKY